MTRMIFFLAMSQIAFPKSTSNHVSILLKLVRWARGPNPFKFEEMWFKVDDFFEVVEPEWNKVSFMAPLVIFSL